MPAPTNIRLFNCDCFDLMKEMANESVDIICIDPPYLYLKNQKLERPFDEKLFFSECKRILTKDGFIVMFGRGESFYRWNTRLSDMEFIFKEEIVWDKSYSTSPLMALSRVHETISIFTKGKGVINRVKIPYLEMKNNDVSAICQDIKRLKSILKNSKSLEAVNNYLTGGERYQNDRSKAIGVSISGGIVKNDDRAAAVIMAFDNGLNEKDIIKSIRDHYSAIHPTQKPVRLLERLLALVLPKNKQHNEIIVADFFGGSFSTMEACCNMGLQGISCEIDEEYFNAGKQRIENLQPVQKQLFA